MICKKCGKSLPSEGITCTFCGAMMTGTQIKERKNWEDPNQPFQAKLMSDKYGIDKSSLYQKKENKKENKLLGAFVILFVLLILILLVILIYIGR